MRTLISISGGGSFAKLARDHHDGLLEGEIHIVADRPGSAFADHLIEKRGNADYFEQFLALADTYDVIMLTSNWILPEFVVDALAGRLLNQHPSLLPAFPGLNIWDEIAASGVRFSGSTIHFVSAGVDEGPILCQTAFPVPPKTTGDELCRLHWVAARPAFVQALRWMQQGRVTLDPTIGEVVIDGAVFAPGSVSPNLEFDPSRLPLQVS